MTGPPPLSLQLGSGARERAWCAGVWMLAGGAVGLWIQSHAWLGFEGFGGLLGAMSGAAAGAWLARPMQGRLEWDGQAWCLRSRGDVQAQPIDRLCLAIDLGPLVVLRARPGRWAMVSRREAGAQWHGLQLALRFGRGPGGQGVAP